MKRLFFLLTLILLFLNSCDMFIFGQDRTVCGGVVRDVRKIKPLENIKGSVTYLSFEVFNREWMGGEKPLSVEGMLCEGHFGGNVARDEEHESFKFDFDADDTFIKKISNALKESGMLEFNNWNVKVAGLPPTDDFYISAKFSTGESLYINFNGGRSPVGFSECALNFVMSVCRMVDYDPEKCPKLKPYVNPYVGTHNFVYQKSGKTQHFTFIVEPTGGDDGNSEVISDGDFGYVHLRCAANKVSGKYHFDVLRHYDDSGLTQVQKNSLAGIISLKNGDFYLEPLQAAPDLPDRSLIKQE